jgi:CheY-like chemotaxis protein
MDERQLILIVDDDRDFCELLTHELHAADFDVMTAENGEIGYQKARDLCPALVVMDVQMPVLNGVDALEKIKEDPTTKETRVLMLTAFGEKQEGFENNDRRFAHESGAVEYISKDENLGAVVAKIKSVLA